MLIKCLQIKAEALSTRLSMLFKEATCQFKTSHHLVLVSMASRLPRSETHPGLQISEWEWLHRVQTSTTRMLTRGRGSSRWWASNRATHERAVWVKQMDLRPWLYQGHLQPLRVGETYKSRWSGRSLEQIDQWSLLMISKTELPAILRNCWASPKSKRSCTVSNPQTVPGPQHQESAIPKTLPSSLVVTSQVSTTQTNRM